jgi:hypothetical protein
MILVCRPLESALDRRRGTALGVICGLLFTVKISFAPPALALVGCWMAIEIAADALLVSRTQLRFALRPHIVRTALLLLGIVATVALVSLLF